MSLAASVAEQKRNGEAGRFGTKTTSAPSAALATTIAVRNGLTPAEYELVREHLGERGPSATERQTIADALRTRVDEAEAERLRIDETIQAHLGADIIHAAGDNGRGLIVAETSSDQGVLATFAHDLAYGQRYMVDGAVYDTPDEIPEHLADARATARGFFAQSAALDESIRAHDEHEAAHARWREFAS